MVNINPPHPDNSWGPTDVQSHLHGYTNFVAHEKNGPLVITGGDGVRVVDEKGNSYIEGLGGLWCTALGFSEERLINAAVNQMKTLPYYHSFGGKAAVPTIQLAEKLLALAPVPMSKVFFANSGSEANDTAVKIIWYYHNAIGKPDKKKIICRTKGYHGVTVCTASMTGLPNNHRAFDLPIDRILHTSCPHYYGQAKPGESENDYAKRCADELEQMILHEGPETVAAFFAEPVMGAGGVITPPEGYFEAVQPVLKKYDILFVADEVICGFGRTGNFWGSETYGMEPDMLACAKALSSAYLPISALMINEKVYQAIRDQSGEIGIFGHGYTYGGHPVAAAVALEALAIYEERDIVSKVRSIATLFQNRIRALGDHPLIGEARGVGLIAGLEMAKDKASRTAFAPSDGIGPYCWGRIQHHGVITRVIGDTIAFAPPLIIDEKDITEMFDAVGHALDDTLVWAKANNKL